MLCETRKEMTPGLWLLNPLHPLGCGVALSFQRICTGIWVESEVRENLGVKHSPKTCEPLVSYQTQQT